MTINLLKQPLGVRHESGKSKQSAGPLEQRQADWSVKYLNNIIEQDHRFIKKVSHPMTGFKAFHSTKATIDGIETAHMIRKGQLGDHSIPAYQQFMVLAG
jgi:transposase-like protein